MIVSDPVVVRACVDNLTVINDLIVKAKSFWGYPESYLKSALEMLKIDVRYLSENLCFEIVLNEKVVGFAAVAEKNGDKYLDHLWIHPTHHKMGLGRFTCQRVLEIGQVQGWRELFVLPDPPATGFYRRLGFTETSVQVPSRIKDGPVFSLLRFDFNHGSSMKSVPANLYSPRFYRENRQSIICDFIREFPFATLLSMQGGQISHLPITLEQSDTHGDYLLGHMAKANPHWRELEKRTRCQVIFHGPHGYISPAWYTPKEDNVPTWNYTVVHATGQFEVVASSEAWDLMNRLVAQFESKYGTGWQLPKDEKAVAVLMNEIVVFRIGELSFDAKFKLSQNQSQANRDNVISQLKISRNQILENLAEKMKFC